MTLQASGGMSFADIRAELRGTGSLTFPDATTRWLADLPSGSMTIPTHFYGKQALKLVGVGSAGASSGSIGFHGVGFGPEFPGRTIIAAVHLLNTGDAALPTSTGSIGGVAAVRGGDSGENSGTTAPLGSAGVSFWAAQPSGTSGSVIVNFSNSITSAACYAFSVAGLTSLSYIQEVSQNGAGNGGASSSTAINVASNGIVFLGISRANNTNGVSFGGAIPLVNSAVGPHWVGVAVANRLPANAAYPVSWSSSGVASFGFQATSYT